MKDATVIRLYHNVPQTASKAEIVELAEAWMAGERDMKRLAIATGIPVGVIPRSLRTRLFSETVQSMVRAKALLALDHAVDSADADQRSEDPKVRSVARDFLLKAASRSTPTTEQEKEDKNWDPSQDEMLVEKLGKLSRSLIPSPGGEGNEAAS